MADFVSETFDSSETEEHNKYSALARKTEYQFTLVPPLFNDSYKLSSIYEPILELSNEAKKIHKVDFTNAIDRISKFSEQEGLSFVFSEINDWYLWFSKAVKNYTYKNFYSKNSQFLSL